MGRLESDGNERVKKLEWVEGGLCCCREWCVELCVKLCVDWCFE